MPATLTPGATTGSGITFTASASVFLQADVGRIIVYAASRAIITAFGSGSSVTADIIDDFPNTSPIPARSWFLRLSPQTTLDPDIRQPVGAMVTLVAGLPAFRASDVGKFISIYGGLVQIKYVDSTIQVRGPLLSEMSTTLDNPPPAPAGSWTLEISSWSNATGWPRTGEFFQGRLGQASTLAQPTTFWLSASDNFDNYATGVKANDAIEYTIASRKINRIEWLADHVSLFIGTSGAEFSAEGTNQSNPLGGDAIPIVSKLTQEGSAPQQPVIMGKRLVFVDRSRRKIFQMIFDFYENGFNAEELTVASQHITGAAGIRMGPVAVTRRPDPRFYFVRNDGELVVLTYLPLEKIVGFVRVVTDGHFESVAVIPQGSGSPDQVWVTVARTLGEVTHRYVERFDEDALEFTRPWQVLYTDAAVTYAGDPISTLSGLGHLEGKTVDIVGDGSFRGTAVVSGGVVNFVEPYSEVEVGLDYASTFVSMRPGIQGSVIEGLMRNWNAMWVRLDDTVGGHLNDELLEYAGSPLNEKGLYTGDRRTTNPGWDTTGRVKVEQRQPYPMTLLACFGELEVGGEGTHQFGSP